MNFKEYKAKTKYEFLGFNCVQSCHTYYKDELSLGINIEKHIKPLYEYLENNKDRFIIREKKYNRLTIKLINISNYIDRTELDIEIEELENRLKMLKEKRKQEEQKETKQAKIKKLKEEIRKLEEN